MDDWSLDVSLSGDAAYLGARALVDGLAERGCPGVVISPGSRSTPLVLAFVRDGRIPVRVVLDERSAAFTALGLAKATGLPAACVCTSGTAGANYLPAVIEASMSRVPLILLTADRPEHLVGTGANQTIDQRDLFGRHARRSFDGATTGWEIFDAAMARPPGPVHVNLAFDEPLVPGDVAPATVTIPPPPEPASGAPLDDDLHALLAIVRAERGVICAGSPPGPVPALADLATTLAWPLLAEPHADVAGMRAGESLAADDGFVADHRPDVVLQFGGLPTTRPMQRLAASAGERIVVDPDGWRRDGGAPARTLAADPAGMVGAVLAAVEPRQMTAWLRSWIEADATAGQALDARLDAEWSETRIARDVAASVPAGGTLVVGNSRPVRDLAIGWRPRSDVRVLSNRGASGIDGVVSTIRGAAWSGAPTVGLIGDLTVLHDAGGLVWGDLGCVLVVINNDGGRIFDLLPSASLPENETYFVAPPSVDLGALARAAGATHARVTDAAGLRAAMNEALARGEGLVEAVV